MEPHPSEASKKNRENQFIEEFVSTLQFQADGCRIETHKSVLYDLTVDDDGNVRMGVDSDTGETIRGGGKGFEQDILIFEPKTNVRVSVVPRVIIEVKFGGVTTHDAIVYNEKARRVRAVYPYVRYGFLLGGMKAIPGRVLRLGQGFDFIVAVSHPLVARQIESMKSLIVEEVAAS